MSVPGFTGKHKSEYSYGVSSRYGHKVSFPTEHLKQKSVDSDEPFPEPDSPENKKKNLPEVIFENNSTPIIVVA